MIGYNPSHLNKNETLLEAFHRVEAYLKANPQYQVFFAFSSYQNGKLEYPLRDIIVPAGSKVGAGDVVLFSNVYYGVVKAVTETTYVVATGVNFRGENGTDGVTPNISMNASVDNNVGTPSVDVTKGGTSENPTFSIAFKNLKGEVGQTGATGAKGNDGKDALVYTADNGVLDGKLVSGKSIYIQNSSFNRSPVLNDVFVLYDTYNQYGILKCIFVETERSQFSILTVVSTKGATGATGAGVPSGGTAGQVLGKRSATDYDTEWVDAGGGGSSLTKHSVSLTKENVATYAAQFENMIAPQLKVTSDYGISILHAGKQLFNNEISGSAMTGGDRFFIYAGCNELEGRFAGYYLPALSGGNEGTVASWNYKFNGLGTITAMDLIWYTL